MRSRHSIAPNLVARRPEKETLWQESDDILGASGSFSAAGLCAFRVAVRTIDLNRYVNAYVHGGSLC